MDKYIKLDNCAVKVSYDYDNETKNKNIIRKNIYVIMSFIHPKLPENLVVEKFNYNFNVKNTTNLLDNFLQSLIPDKSLDTYLHILARFIFIRDINICFLSKKQDVFFANFIKKITGKYNNNILILENCSNHVKNKYLNNLNNDVFFSYVGDDIITKKDIDKLLLLPVNSVDLPTDENILCNALMLKMLMMFKKKIIEIDIAILNRNGKQFLEQNKKI
ncbi:hypothetical protein Hokovirus_3_117 [Hokovirus HKV1]|uniref:Uncharacterized protein n=1 Tax=Hokovirus HKV1 TaxID=1977638 RepID=A0A1V0SGS0_9VIRU|nr:hypothetical protein Hokovirus_3_117 [Hokovirus HKV1]